MTEDPRTFGDRNVAVDALFCTNVIMAFHTLKIETVRGRDLDASGRLSNRRFECSWKRHRHHGGCKAVRGHGPQCACTQVQQSEPTSVHVVFRVMRCIWGCRLITTASFGTVSWPRTYWQTGRQAGTCRRTEGTRMLRYRQDMHVKVDATICLV